MSTHADISAEFQTTVGFATVDGRLDAPVIERDLIASDLGLELFVLTLRDTPSLAVQWLLRGKVSLDRLPVDPSALRYNEELVQSLREKLSAGQELVFSSALPALWQKIILEHLGLTTESVTREQLASTPKKIASSPFMAIAKAIRLHQWSKNILLFVPLLLSHQMFASEPLINTILAFICFGLVASSIYLLNDIMDLRQDRRHPSKMHRPFASGALPVSAALFLIPAMITVCTIIALTLPKMFGVTLLAYITLNLGYTFYLKRKLLVDVLALSGAYTLRILAGNAAGPVELSNWLLAFSMFLFLSLALVKRYVELDTVETDDPDAKRFMGRGYRKTDLDMLSQLGVASGFAAVIVLALFVEGAGKSGLYKHRELIWLVCPIVLYVIGRIWVLAKRRELPDDPIMFIIKDWRSHLMAVIVGIIFIMAT